MYNKRGLTFGVGINDADYVACTTRQVVDEDGCVISEVVKCPYYTRWHNMLKRCYAENRASCCDEWKYLSVFRAWMETQDWEGKQLDKDLLYPGVNLYSPETCAFITKETNNFIRESDHTKTLWPPGCSWVEKRQKFRSAISEYGKITFLGYFDTAWDAHHAWKARKHKIALELAEVESDPRVVKALTTKYL